ncbi:hypothetical protein ACHAWF_003480 [Thalassiosira exigua]
MVMAQGKKQVCLLGAGSYGTAIARIVAANLASNGDAFHPTLRLWVRRSELAEEINAKRTNSRYLAGAAIPDNVEADTDFARVVRGCDVIVVGVPHQHVTNDMLEKIREGNRSNGEGGRTVHVVHLCKGIYMDESINGGKLTRVSERLHQALNDGNGSTSFVISALMGANVYDQMGRDEFAEATLACPSHPADLTPYRAFHDPDRLFVSATPDVAGVEFCGVLKNVVALGVGYALGLDLGSNSQAAIVRRGLKEMVAFAEAFGGDDVRRDTFFESAGVADLMTTCFAGRGRRLASAFVKAGGKRKWGELEDEVLGGHRIPDWHNVQVIYKFLEGQGEDAMGRFPFFCTVYEIGFANTPATEIVEVLKR